MQNLLIYLALMGIMLQAGGCVTSMETVETTPEFGSSVRMAVQSQIANPEAGQDDAPVVGIDGRYAAKVAEKYNNGPKDKKDRSRPSMFGVVESN